MRADPVDIVLRIMNEARAGRVQLVGEIGAHMSDPLQGDGDAVEFTPQAAAHAELDPAEDPLGRHRARIARGGRKPAPTVGCVGGG